MTGAADRLLDGIVAGRYRVIKQLGAGGMGAVYLAEKLAIRKQVALKVLLAEYASEPSVMARFEREAISAASIKHPNVVEVFDFGRLDDGAFFLEMEFLEGNDLDAEIARYRVLEPARAVQIAGVICRALAAAHKSGVVHRDMKPANVFLQRTPDGEEIVKVVDFGIAKSSTGLPAGASEKRLTRTGSVFGTPEYMSPEQANGEQVDSRSDIYAVGIILYKMLTGSVPFTGETMLAILSKHVETPVPPMRTFYGALAVSAELETVVACALEKQAGARYPSMSEFAQALAATPEAGAVSDGATAQPSPSGAAPPAARTGAVAPRARSSSRTLLFAALAFAGIVFLLALLAQRNIRGTESTNAASPSAPVPPSIPGRGTTSVAPASPSTANDKQKSTQPLCESMKDGIRMVGKCPNQ